MQVESSPTESAKIKLFPVKNDEEIPPPPPPSDDTTPIADLYLAVTEAMWGINPIMPVFPRKFFVVEPDLMAGKLVLEEDPNGECRYVHQSIVIDAILQYARETCRGMKDYKWTRRQAKDCADFWMSMSRGTSIDDVAPVRWAPEAGRCFKRLPWDYRTGPTPTWDSLCGKMQNAEAFKHFIGSMMFPTAYNQQYCWVRGPGGDGKGSINRWLSRVFDGSYVSRRPPTADDRFWSFGLLGKRVAVLPDCDNARFVTSGLWKALTGGDPVEIEAKGKMSFTLKKPNCKFLVLSQKRPCISSDLADRRRLIYCELVGAWEDLSDDEMAVFEEKLWQEGGYFLASCQQGYAEKYPTLGRIKSELTPEMDGWVSVLEEDFETFFAHFFIIDGDASKKDLWITPAVMQELLSTTWRERDKQLEFMAWLERVHKVSKLSVKTPQGKVIKAYRGLIQRPATQHNN